MKISKGLTQAYQVQDFAHAALMAMRDMLTKDGKLVLTRDDATAIGQVVRAWESAQERIRIHRGKPLPGSLKPTKKPEKVKSPVMTFELAPVSTDSIPQESHNSQD